MNFRFVWNLDAEAFTQSGYNAALAYLGSAYINVIGLDDDPPYVNNFLDWMKYPANNVAYESYFDYDGDGTNSIITGGSLPISLAAFKADLG